MHKTPIITTAGEILVEFVSHQKNCGLEHISEYSGPYPSGAPAIFLDQAARMGVPTQLFGGIGNDGFGRCVLSRLQGDGVGTQGVNIHDTLSTGTAFVSYYDNGTRDFIFHLENTSSDHFDIPQHLLLQLIDPANTWLHVSGASLGNARMRKEILKLASHIEDGGGKIVCDPNARPELIRDQAASAALQDIVARSFCLMPSTSDLKFLFPTISEAAAVDQLLEAQAEIIVIKKGEKGASVFAKDQRYEFAGHAVEEIDPTGAGDCFCGTFISLLAQGASPQQAGTRANAAGAIAVTRRGPMEGNSSPQEISDFLNNHSTKELPA